MSTTPQDWNKMTVVQLKAELTKRGLVTTGKKADLVERLQADTQGITCIQYICLVSVYVFVTKKIAQKSGISFFWHVFFC